MLRAAEDPDPGFGERLKSCVGFLTSSDVDCGTSAIMVSQNPELVYVFGTARPGYVPGCRVQNSMFMRQLLWLWAYGLSDQKLPMMCLFRPDLNESRLEMKPRGLWQLYCAILVKFWAV
jgi:hypothetical protein